MSSKADKLGEADMLKYFSQPGFQRLFQGIMNKYRSLGRFGGTVQIRKLTPQEQETLGGFLGRNLQRQGNLTVSLAEVARIIQESRFGIGLGELLPALFSENLLSNREIAKEQEKRWLCLFDEAEAHALREKTREWLKEVKEGKGPGYRTFLGLYQENVSEAKEIIAKCIQALDTLPVLTGDRCRKPVFAARITGNPHGLDKGEVFGKLFYSAILHILGIDTGDYRSEKMREVFRQAGLEDDDLSSNVIVAGLKTEREDPMEGLFESARVNLTPLILPLRFFEQKIEWYPFSEVYVVENPTVMSAILDAWDEPGLPPIVCTSGQPSVAALKLLDAFSAAGTKICYSGDFDGKGLEIGVGLYNRYKEVFAPLLFDTLTYESSIAGTKLSEEQRKRVDSLEIPWDSDLRKALLRRGYVVYQEALVKRMIDSLRKRNNHIGREN